ncbi:MAG TPA: glycosyltransferase family A protein [Kofleriaceae bacterium]
MTVSVVVETWNIDGDAEQLAALLGKLAPQVAAEDAEVIVTHAKPAHANLDAMLGRPIRWLELPRAAGYYEHKNAGFAAATGDIIAFIDGDCDPTPGWLAAMLEPFATGARVVAGATSYAGDLAPLANELDFPYFDPERRHFGATTRTQSATVLNFFANNVAFARDVFAAHRYPTIEPMFHGQCQVLALQLANAGIAITFAPNARVTHAWPDDAAEWLQVRLLRGADTTQLLPHVLAAHAPRINATVGRLGPLPALAVFGLRALRGAWSALRRGPALRGLALIAGVTAVDAIGAVAAPAVYRWIA